ncbi:hypothetical protein HDA40_002836 [Hamadaea flava]|uniref:DUF2975 domain-containing protein n=1 Tax=Hamadaea flava TaxID=1742688 RepID=A0ABV8LJS4_9ACTN|nr:DUF2975 domain-containing protein [Hamadaea flava]MCP2324329.1 hypothetical protein [Hamadaea flava]
MEERKWGNWLRGLGAIATFVQIAALCVAVAVLVIAFIPKSPVAVELPTSLLPASLSSFASPAGSPDASPDASSAAKVVPGVEIDPEGTVMVRVTDPSLAQRLLYLVTVLPGLLLIAEIARRLAGLLRIAREQDPFSSRTAKDLTVLAKITAFGGAGAWAVAIVALWVLSTTVLRDGGAFVSTPPLLPWVFVAFIFAGFGQLIARGVAMRTELDTVI